MILLYRLNYCGFCALLPSFLDNSQRFIRFRPLISINRYWRQAVCPRFPSPRFRIWCWRLLPTLQKIVTLSFLLIIFFTSMWFAFFASEELNLFFSSLFSIQCSKTMFSFLFFYISVNFLWNSDSFLLTSPTKCSSLKIKLLKYSTGFLLD